MIKRLIVLSSLLIASGFAYAGCNAGDPLSGDCSTVFSPSGPREIYQLRTPVQRLGNASTVTPGMSPPQKRLCPDGSVPVKFMENGYETYCPNTAKDIREAAKTGRDAALTAHEYWKKTDQLRENFPRNKLSDSVGLLDGMDDKLKGISSKALGKLLDSKDFKDGKIDLFKKSGSCTDALEFVMDPMLKILDFNKAVKIRNVKNELDVNELADQVETAGNYITLTFNAMVTGITTAKLQALGMKYAMDYSDNKSESELNTSLLEYKNFANRYAIIASIILNDKFIQDLSQCAAHMNGS